MTVTSRRRSAPTEPRGERIFVLAGGSNLGATQAGQLLELSRCGIVPDRVVGCSVGALNGVFFAVEPTVGRAEELVELWTGPRPQEVFSSRRLTVVRKLAGRADHLVDSERLVELLRGDLGVELLEDTAVPVEVLATNLSTGGETWFSRGPAVAALTASCALPGVFPPVRIGGDVYVDGGVVSPCPVRRALLRHPAEVWVLDTPTRPWNVPARLTALEVLLRSFYVACRDPGHGPLPEGTRLLHLHTDIPERLHIGFDDFTHSSELIEVGAASARTAIEQYRADTAGPAWRLSRLLRR